MRSPTSSNSSRTLGSPVYKRLRIAQLAISALCLVFSIAVVATAGHSLQVYRQQREDKNPWWLPLWPGHFDISGTHVLIGTGSVIIALNIIYLTVSLVPKVFQHSVTLHSLADIYLQLRLSIRPTLSALAALALTAPSILLSLFTVIYVHVLNKHGEDAETIQTWTCKFRTSQPVASNMNIPTEMSNEMFGTLCTESVRLL